SIANLLGVLEHFKFALNVAFFVRHEYFLHPKSGNLQEVSRESVHTYTKNAFWARIGHLLQACYEVWCAKGRFVVTSDLLPIPLTDFGDAL
ncbi:MAG: hypothetical protein ABJH45_03705, partial [Paracoccaceae bacterium]